MALVGKSAYEQTYPKFPIRVLFKPGPVVIFKVQCNKFEKKFTVPVCWTTTYCASLTLVIKNKIFEFKLLI